VTKKGNNSFREWNEKWKEIGYLKDANLKPYNKDVGLYRLKLDNRVVYIGRATELNNGGIRKRLSDYRRDNDSARNYKSGRKINNNIDNIIADILVVGNTEEAISITISLEDKFIKHYNPLWNQ